MSDKRLTPARETALAVVAPAVPMPDAAHGGITTEDIVLPRVMLLQAMTPDLASYYPALPGDFASNVTKEKIAGTFIPLFAFKFYAKYGADRKFEWGTVDRTDPRVVEGLRWIVDGAGRKTTAVTETLNFLVVINDEVSTPYILTFKRTSMPVGRKFLSLLQMRSSKNQMGIPVGDFYKSRYTLSSKETRGDKGTYFIPIVDSPKDKDESIVPPEIQQEAVRLVNHYMPFMAQVATGAHKEDGQEEGYPSGA